MLSLTPIWFIVSSDPMPVMMKKPPNGQEANFLTGRSSVRMGCMYEAEHDSDLLAETVELSKGCDGRRCLETFSKFKESVLPYRHKRMGDVPGSAVPGLKVETQQRSDSRCTH
ncbi:hypothetical protein N657DRAFT_674697 [Parathielavia appendiculata]|uniref:Uncharacterized protein n=1 Tax=Parathielavia appendiculata TaxID=2587402 RepID=A0AAN6TS53_9PEZI|nr:hypothetical protein N657DRAFT_674697 [Parathielavia appendiculata]